MIKSIVTSVVAAIVVVAAFFGITGGVHTTVQPAPIVRGASSDFSNVPYLNVNGITEWYSSMPIRQGNATTTICSFPAPSASSTVQFVSVRFGGITSSGIKIDIGTSTTAQGTTTNLVTQATAATSSASGWKSGQFAQSIINSGEFLNVVTSALATTTGGYCQAEFTQY